MCSCKLCGLNSNTARHAELPFKLYNIPDVDVAKARWTDVYLLREMENVPYRVEESNDNHFMYWTTQVMRQARSFVHASPLVYAPLKCAMHVRTL